LYSFNKFNDKGIKLTGRDAVLIILLEHTWYAIASLASYPKIIGIIIDSLFVS
jgi:hypothetical protein